MIRRQEHLRQFREAVIHEGIVFGESYLRRVAMPEYDPSRSTIDYHIIRDNAKKLIHIYTTQLKKLEQKEQEIHENFKRFQEWRQLERKRRKKKGIDIQAIRQQRDNFYAIPPRHLSLDDLEAKETLEGQIRQMQMEYSCPDCTNSLRFWLVHLKDSKSETPLPTISSIRVFNMLNESKDQVSVTFTHSDFPTPFRSSMGVGLLYYLYGKDALNLIIREADLSFNQIEKRKNDARSAKEKLKKK